jgi:hypothetical protein
MSRRRPEGVTVDADLLGVGQLWSWLTANRDARRATRGGLGCHDDLDVVVQRREVSQESFDGEAVETSTGQRRYLRLIDAEHLCGSRLGPTPTCDDLADGVGQFGLCKGLLGIGNSQVGKDVTTAYGVVSLLAHELRSSVMPALIVNLDCPPEPLADKL